MEHWHTGKSVPYQSVASGISSSRILTPSSGNAQTYTLDSNDGIENQNPLPPEVSIVQHEVNSESQYPIPRLKLGSNDQHVENIARLQARRQQNREKSGRRRRIDPERPYLHHPKYIQYRARPRTDTGADGKPVWDDLIEDAFQNALVNIKPMGRRKKSQRGRPHGRNELISEWIFQETGEYRTRKQVSSHIQVLNALLKGIPEWDALTTPDERAGSERPNHEYYSDSIEQMVRSQASMPPNAYYQNSSHAASSRSYSLPSTGGFVDQHNLTRLSFEMWVSLPKQMDQALHTYTRLQSSSTTLAPAPLEELKDWRTSFPRLRPVVENWPVADQCDIIVLEASFQLMSDFPPKFSKLGISLELDFLHPSNNNGGSLANLTEWTCVTHMYQHGRLEKRLEHEDCHVSGIGKVKPFFESKWWASTFTQLTEKRKMAEDSKSDAAIEAANETSRNFFRGLTVMQEISASTMKGGLSNGIYRDPIPQRKCMAVLLWKFAQAPVSYVGTTTWQKLVLPPDRTLTNSPTPLVDISLPPLVMDSMLENAQDDNLFGPSQNFMTDTGQQYSLFDTDMGNELCQDGFIGYKADSLSGFDALHSTFNMPSSYNTLGHDLNLSFNLPAHGMSHLDDHPAPATNNFFELPHIRREESRSTSVIAHASQQGSFRDTDEQSCHQPLANFDMTTHKMLQAQLGNDGNHDTQPSMEVPAPTTRVGAQHHSPVDPEEEAWRAAFLTASAMSNLNNHSYSQQQQPTYTSTPPVTQLPYIPSTTTTFTSPPITRPPLQAHHSFAGVGQGLHSRESSHGDFEKTLANLQAFTDNHDMNFPFDLHGNSHPEGIGQKEISRPRSQPTLPATLHSHDVYNELHALHGGGFEAHSQSVFSAAALGMEQSPTRITQTSQGDSGLGGSAVELKHEDANC